MALFKQNATRRVPEPSAESTGAVEEQIEDRPLVDADIGLPEPPPTKDGVRDFWAHRDYLMSLIPELTEFGVPVLDAIGLTLNETILAEQEIGELAVGQILFGQGMTVEPRMLPLLVAMGISKVMARPSPRVLVMALSSQAIPGSYLAAALAQAAGAQAYRLEYIYNTPARLVDSITEQLVRADLVVTVGGLGEAKVDLRAVANQLGINDFTPVAISPGRDHGFILAEQKVPLVAMPADPSSVFVLSKLLLEPMVAQLMGAVAELVLAEAQLAQPIRLIPEVLTCVPAQVDQSLMTITGRPSGFDGLNSIYRANALALLTSDTPLVNTEADVIYLPLS
jgi:molybdopterin molybdotransferase